MELRKVIIDGKEYYEEVVDCDGEEAKGADNSDRGFKDGAKAVAEKICDGAKDFGIKVADTAKDFGIKTAEVAKSFGIKTAEMAKDFGKKTVEVGVKVKESAKATGQKIKEGAERLFAKDKSLDPSSKEAKLIKLLPYMSRKETHEVALRLLENDSALMGVDLSAVLPFISGEDCNAIFQRCIEIGKQNFEISTVMQFVDYSVLTAVVDGYLAGKYPKLDIDEFYPFLEDKDIKRIFDHIVGE